MSEALATALQIVPAVINTGIGASKLATKLKGPGGKRAFHLTPGEQRELRQQESDIPPQKYQNQITPDLEYMEQAAQSLERNNPGMAANVRQEIARLKSGTPTTFNQEVMDRAVQHAFQRDREGAIINPGLLANLQKGRYKADPVYMQQAASDIASSDPELAQEIYGEIARMQSTGTEFDSGLFNELLEYSRERDPGMYENLAAGVSPVEGSPYDLYGEFLDPTREDIQLAMGADYARAKEIYDPMAEMALQGMQGFQSRFGLTPEGEANVGNIFNEIDAAKARIRPMIDESQQAMLGDIEGTRQRIEQDYQQGVGRHEEMRSRALGEFQSDAARRIDLERSGMMESFRAEQDVEMSELQAQGLSQREILGVMRDRKFQQHNTLAQMSQRHNQAVASERANLARDYDSFTSNFMTTMGTAKTGAEVNLADQHQKAQEMRVFHNQQLEQWTIGQKIEADKLLLKGLQDYSGIVTSLMDAMPQKSQYLMGAYNLNEYEMFTDRADVDQSVASMTAALESIQRVGESMQNKEIAESQMKSQEKMAQTSMFGSLGAAGIGTLGSIF